MFTLAEFDQVYAPSCRSIHNSKYAMRGRQTGRRASALTRHCFLKASKHVCMCKVLCSVWRIEDASAIGGQCDKKVGIDLQLGEFECGKGL